MFTWYSVKDKMPFDDLPEGYTNLVGRFLVYEWTKYCRVGRVSVEEHRQGGSFDADVTHWAFFPEPPVVEEEEEDDESG